MTERVYVRGSGAVSSLGDDWPTTVAALAEGACAVREVTAFDASGFPCTVAAAIDGRFGGVWGGERVGRVPFVRGGNATGCPPGAPPSVTDVWEDRRRGFAERAAREAWAAAAVSAAPDRIGVFVGAESGRARFETVLALSRAAGGGKKFDHEAFGLAARAMVDRVDASVLSPSAIASHLAGMIGARGPAETVCLACASGLAAIIEGARAIRLGECDVALCGGVGADVDPLMLAGFGLLGALSAKGVSRPFDCQRDGFVVGEGAAMVVLARERGASRVALSGVGRSLDAHHLTAPDPEGSGAARAMRAALEDAGWPRIGYVQAHGTSTPLNDAVEAAALRRVLGAGLDDARVGSVKGALGHWVAGAGALGFLCAVEAVERGTLLPTAGLREPDATCALPHVMGRAARGSVEAALVNAFAFGGANASAVVTRVEASA